MIHVTEGRVRGNEPPFPLTYSDINIVKATEKMLLWEIGYGGIITELEPTKVSIQTRIMDCIDTTIFTGTEEEMKPMLEIAVVLMTVHPASSIAPKELVDAVMQNVYNVLSKDSPSGCTPLMLKLGGEMLMGKSTLKTTIVILLVGDMQDEEMIRRLMRMHVKDLFTMYTMVKFENCSLEDVMELTTA